jgi:predicted outer membrane lipoprotein
MKSKGAGLLVSIGVFAYALVLYLLTVAPTASFWDAGEFIAIAHGLQVSHPPGAPFYMLVGRLFSMFVPTDLIALSVNLVSVFSSAFTILLTYWIIVRLLREFSQDTRTGNSDPVSATFLQRFGGVVGACTFAVTDSFWFNAVEAEVYAMSMLFTALVVWLIMKWSDLAREELANTNDRLGLGANRILVLVAYLFGLAIGVHLLSLLALFFIALIFFFVEYDRKEWDVQGQPGWKSRKRWQAILLTLVVASVAFLVIYPGIIQKLPGFAGEIGQPLIVLLLVALGVVAAVWITHTRQKQTANLVVVCLLMVLIGYSSYAVIFIRSAADPPIDENDPETPEAIVSYLEREQYGETPILTGPSFNNATGGFDENNEKLFPRRHSPQPQHVNIYRRYNSDMEFFWKYQLGHMYLRYFLWNFSGRESDVEGARPITGITFIEGPNETLQQTPSEKASRNRYFALPLLLGFFGMFYHFRRDWRRAFSVLILFLVTGVGIILYLNQTPMQPRERDYSYVASFFAFSLWIGIGASGFLRLVQDAIGNALRNLTWVVAAIVFLAVPGWMTVENFDDHDRSGRYIAPDYAHNMLMSVASDGILFTNGDNDTFPLWYAQEVEGVRRDVRVANLSLLNTPWYVRQLKNQYSRESSPLPIGMSERDIDGLGASLWEPRTIQLPVDPVLFSEESEVFIGQADRSMIDSSMTWTLRGRPFGTDPQTGETRHLLYGADWAALNIIAGAAADGWKRPVYFAVTVAPDGRLDLQNYFQLEGKALRIVPIRHENSQGRVELGVTPERLKTFRFRNLNNPKVYYDSNIRNMVDNYRNIFAQTAMALIEGGQLEEGVALMDGLSEKIPFTTIPGDFASFMYVSGVYEQAGDYTKALQILQYAEPLVRHRLRSPNNSQRMNEMNYALVDAIRGAYVQAEDYEGAATFENNIREDFGEEANVTADQMRALMMGLPEGTIFDSSGNVVGISTQDPAGQDSGVQDEIQ